MDRQDFLGQVAQLRGEGKSIRSIAAELDVHRTRVHRALNSMKTESTGKMAEHGGTCPRGKSRESVLIGRQQEMYELRAALDDAAAGHGRVVMLSGEPGIGKTRLAQEMGAVAAANGVQTLWGRCYEGQGAPSFWPWVQIVRDYVRDGDSGQLISEMGAGAASIAEIISELKERLPGLESPAPLDSPEASRFRLFDAIASFLKKAAQSKPTALVLEDLHWADRPSLLLLEFLAHDISNSRILIVATSRYTDSEHALSQTIGELARESYFQHIDIPRLELSDVSQYIQETSGTRPSDEHAQAIFDRTEGNPFFMAEMVRLMIPSGGQITTAASMPDSVRGAIGRRLDGLSPKCIRALAVASLIGREFDLKAVGALLPDITLQELSSEIEAAVRLRIVDEVVGDAIRYQFSHVLVQEAISAELSRSRKEVLHGEIGEALEELYADEAETHADELAYHFAEASPPLGGPKLVRYSLMAGERGPCDIRLGGRVGALRAWSGCERGTGYGRRQSRPVVWAGTGPGFHAGKIPAI